MGDPDGGRAGPPLDLGKGVPLAAGGEPAESCQQLVDELVVIPG